MWKMQNNKDMEYSGTGGGCNLMDGWGGQWVDVWDQAANMILWSH